MLKPGPAKKLIIHLDESDRLHGKPVYEVLLHIFYKRKISGGSMFRGIEGSAWSWVPEEPSSPPGGA